MVEKVNWEIWKCQIDMLFPMSKMSGPVAATYESGIPARGPPWRPKFESQLCRGDV